MRERLIEIDILRTIAILIIVFVHLPLYAFDVFNYLGSLSVFRYPIVHIALGLFFFISGFGMHLNKRPMNTLSDVRFYFKRRFTRIFPLYWVAFGTFLIGFFLKNELSLSFCDIIIHLFGLQIIFPYLCGGVGPVDTLWFIGLILTYYVLYAVITFFAKDTKRVIKISFILFLIFILFFSGDDRFFYYYFTFIGGIIASEIKIFYPGKYNRPLIYLLLISGMILVISSFFYLELSSDGSYDPNVEFYDEHPKIDKLLVKISFIQEIKFKLLFLGFLANLSLMMLSAIFIVFWLVKFCAKFIEEKERRIFSLFAISSYSIYLFHRPFLYVFKRIVEPLFQDTMMYYLSVVLIGLPTLFIISYFIQVASNKILKKISERNTN